MRKNFEPELISSGLARAELDGLMAEKKAKLDELTLTYERLLEASKKDESVRAHLPTIREGLVELSQYFDSERRRINFEIESLSDAEREELKAQEKYDSYKELAAKETERILKQIEAEIAEQQSEGDEPTVDEIADEILRVEATALELPTRKEVGIVMRTLEVATEKVKRYITARKLVMGWASSKEIKAIASSIEHVTDHRVFDYIYRRISLQNRSNREWERGSEESSMLIREIAKLPERYLKSPLATMKPNRSIGNVDGLRRTLEMFGMGVNAQITADHSKSENEWEEFVLGTVQVQFSERKDRIQIVINLYDPQYKQWAEHYKTYLPIWYGIKEGKKAVVTLVEKTEKDHDLAKEPLYPDFTDGKPVYT